MCCVKGSPRFAARDTGPVWAGIRTRYVYRCVVCWCPCDSSCAVSCVSRPWNLAKRGVAEAASAFNAGVGSGNPHHLATVADIGQPPLSHRTAGETRQIGFASPLPREQEGAFCSKTCKRFFDFSESGRTLCHEGDSSVRASGPFRRQGSFYDNSRRDSL